ncbi:hypothetical protein KGQ19_12785 [Catenulispora sp. NL8]|uniref:Uncharacterized protein n=1 Tax=Catenulispora pinistramenti TaxID=2705254 RepID=A0ABS5KNW6_9ACTN|nr:hypothetical protein [Catenulispora pinistramenti]MBS2547743.1 hypothetical protein [Catenulispora pinistramenti]
MSELAEQLAAGGLELVELVDPLVPLIPPRLANAATSFPPTAEPVPHSAVELEAPDLVAQANSGWYQLASEGGLFGTDREFLVAVEQTGEWWWAHVRLAQSWDVMGRGAASILGRGQGHPGFVMLSLDGSVIVVGNVSQSSVGSTLARDPSRNAGLREFAPQLADFPDVSEQEKAAIGRWLQNAP